MKASPKGSMESAEGFASNGDWTDRLVATMSPVINVGVLVLALLGAWLCRHVVSADGISYLDLADDVRQTGVAGALNGYWSPAYPWVLSLALSIGRPSAYWEAGFVQFVNLVIFLGTLMTFRFFWRELAGQRTKTINGASTTASGVFPGPVWWVFGMALFCQATLEHIPIGAVTPDMILSGTIFASAGLLLRIIRGARWTAYAALGVTLGAGYLSKLALLPLAIVFLGCAAFFGPSRREHWLRMLIALAAFGAIVLPYVAALSLLKDRVTFGDTGKLAYARWVNGAAFPICHGEQAALGRLAHPATVLMDNPEVYAYRGPVSGSFPGWKDPSFWCEGIEPRFDLAEQVGAIRRGSRTFLNMVLRNSGYYSTVIIFFFILWANSRAPRPPLMLQWPLLLVSGSAFAMYSLVLVESRYLAPFWAIALGACLSSLLFKESIIGRRTLNITACLVATLSIILTADAIVAGRLGSMAEPSDRSANSQWQIAKGLTDLGLREGDAVGFIGQPFYAYWARLAKVQLRVSAPGDGAEVLWSRSEGEQAQILGAFAQAGVNAVIVNGIPKHKRDSNWRKIGTTDYYAWLVNANLRPRRGASPVAEDATRTSERLILPGNPRIFQAHGFSEVILSGR